MQRLDPEVFIRKTIENAVDEGDMARALEMSRRIDEVMLQLNRSAAEPAPHRQEA